MADAPQQLPNWITAIATAATAVVTIIAGVAAWFDRRTLLPIFEPDFAWSNSKETLGLLRLQLKIRNRIPETLTITHARVRNPRHMTVTLENYIPQYGSVDIVPTTDRERELSWEIGALGETHSSLAGGGAYPADVAYQTLYFSPPDEWLGGTVSVTFTISSKARAIRDRRKTITRHVSAAPKTKTDAAAKSQD